MYIEAWIVWYLLSPFSHHPLLHTIDTCWRVLVCFVSLTLNLLFMLVVNSPHYWLFYCSSLLKLWYFAILPTHGLMLIGPKFNNLCQHSMPCFFLRWTCFWHWRISYISFSLLNSISVSAVASIHRNIHYIWQMFVVWVLDHSRIIYQDLALV